MKVKGKGKVFIAYNSKTDTVVYKDLKTGIYARSPWKKWCFTGGK